MLSRYYNISCSRVVYVTNFHRTTNAEFGCSTTYSRIIFRFCAIFNGNSSYVNVIFVIIYLKRMTRDGLRWYFTALGWKCDFRFFEMWELSIFLWSRLSYLWLFCGYLNRKKIQILNFTDKIYETKQYNIMK